MKNIIQAFVEYLQDTLGISVKPEEWNGYRSLPVFLQGTYNYYVVWILGKQCLLLVSRGNQETTPATFRKHFDIISKKWPGAIILLRHAIRPNDRRRLVVEYKLPFVVPGNQLYLPDIGIDMREHFRQARKEERLFSPSTQALMLHVILTRNYSPLLSTQLVGILPYTPMTIKRAFDEIEQAQIGSTRMRGRERELLFDTTGHKLWDAVLPYLRSPIQKKVAVKFLSGESVGLEAGITALSRYSMISAPSLPTLAISAGTWKKAKAVMDVCDFSYEDEGAYNLEIWRYDPALLSQEKIVDRLSLFLSLRDSNDERIEAALEEMMENVQW